MSATSLKLPLIGMGVLLVAGVASWVVFGSDDAPAPAPVAPLSARATPAAEPSFQGGPAEGRTTAAEALAPAPAPTPVGGTTGSAQLAADKLAERVPRESIDLTGRVVDDAGRPIEGATVAFHESPFTTMFRTAGGAEAVDPADVATATTARDGSFTLHAQLPEPPSETRDFPLPGVVPQLSTRHDLFATLLTALPQLVAGPHDVGTLVMDPGAWITGRAVDSNQRPVAGASVRARNEGGNRRGSGGGGPGGFFGSMAETLGSVTTGPDGRFTVRGLKEGRASLSVQKQGLRLAARDGLELQARAPVDAGDLVLEDGALISGVVLDESNLPIADASISVSSMARIMVNRIEDLPRGQIGQEFGQRATTDAQGRFEVGGLAGGTYTVHVSAPGRAELSREDVPAGTRNLTLAPVRLGSLLVNLTDSASGKPVEHARIKATQSGDGASRMWRPDIDLAVLEGADAMKVAALDEPPAGAYLVTDAGLDGTRLVVAADGYATQEIDAPAVSSGALGRFVVQLVPAAVVAGVVLDDQRQPVAGALVRLEAEQPAEDGDFFSGDRREIRRSVRIGRDGGDGEEAIDAKRLTARTGADGVYELKGASAGNWTLHASADGFVTSPREKLTLDEGQSQRDVTIALEPAGSLTGLVTEADGTPVADIEVTVTPADAAVPQDSDDPRDEVGRRFGRLFGRGGGAEGERRARTQSNGTYMIDGLKPGEYIARLGGSPRRGVNFGAAMVITMDGSDDGSSANPSAPAHIVAGQEAHVDFVRPRRASISGRVLAGGAAAADVGVTLRRSGGLPFGGERATTDDRGEFRFTDVEAGEYDLTAHAPGAALERKQTVKCSAGQEAHADLTFSGSTLSGRVVDGKTGTGVEGVQLTLVPERTSDGGGGGAPQMAFSFITSGGPGGGPPGGMNMTINGGSVSGARTDNDGHFELKYVEPGSYSLEAKGSGYMEVTQDGLQVAENQNKSDLKLEVSRGGIVEGKVRSGSTGQALDKVPVRISFDGDEQMNVTEAGGAFRFDGLAPGEYKVEALGSGFESDAIASKTVKVQAGETASVDLSTKS